MPTLPGYFTTSHEEETSAFGSREVIPETWYETSSLFVTVLTESENRHRRRVGLSYSIYTPFKSHDVFRFRPASSQSISLEEDTTEYDKMEIAGE